MLPTTLIASNPWKLLSPAPPFVLEEDRPFIERHNCKHRESSYEIVTDILPEPFIGSPAAPIWLLNLNPGFNPLDRKVSEPHKAMQRENLLLKGESFWYVDPGRSSPGHTWWKKNLSGLIQSRGHEWCARNLFVVEIFPYHSVKFARGAQLPSQTFTGELVRWACSTGKRFIIMRQTRSWFHLVPALKTAVTTELKNKRNTWITPGNLINPSILDSVPLKETQGVRGAGPQQTDISMGPLSSSS